jgi:hypothetical protein
MVLVTMALVTMALVTMTLVAMHKRLSVIGWQLGL